MIPDFPAFKPLQISDKHEIEKITKTFEPYSDYNFVSLFCWDVDDQIMISRLNNNLVVLFVDYLDKHRFFTFIGSNKIDETIDRLISTAKSEKIDSTLRLVPEAIVKSIENADRYEIKEDRDSFDYILSVQDLVELKGKKFHPQKNFITRYKKLYQQATHLKPLILSDENTKKEVLNLFYKWESLRNKSHDETDRELGALKKLLDHSHKLDLKALGLFINNELKGFVINELVSDTHGIAHFEKADISHVGIFQYLKHQTALMLKESGRRYINIEQDIGIEGLRKAKMAAHPVHFLKKYTVALR